MEKENIEQYKKRLFEQRETLKSAIDQLKSEFIGINTVIDQIGDAISSWIFFPEMQERPVIINLWGLTGIGKTSLVKRLTELIGYTDRYYRFDLGESTGRYFDIQDSFKDIYENCDGEPFIIALDEFQHARTLNEEKEEIDKASSRAIWDLLDNGKFDLIDFNYNLHWYAKLIKSLDLALEKGVEVKKGLVTTHVDIYKELVHTDNNDDAPTQKKKGEKIYFVSDDNVKTIYEIADFLFTSKVDLRDKLNELDGETTIDYLISLYRKCLRPKTIDCRKSLVFVMGNLDEVYSMTHNFNPDMSANEFHHQSKKITITQVKDALLSRFRSEQIARLGNTHIIYPAFDEKAFYDIIRLELRRIRNKVFDTYQLEMTFDAKTEQLIYEEGVYPTQGTRPLFTTIHQIVNTRLGKILNEIYLNDFRVDSLVFTVNESETDKDNVTLQIDFINDHKKVHQLTDMLPLVLGKLRKEKRNDEQAIVAVHESGHAILSSILMKTIPESVFSVTADSNSNGFVLARPNWEYISKKEIINRLAVLMGGYVAERVIFGEENVTIGSSSDLQQASYLATRVIYSCGMGKTLAAFGNQYINDTPSFILDGKSETVNDEAKELLIRAEELAQQTLVKQKVLLIQMADYLSNLRSANKDKVREFIEKYAIDFDLKEIVEDADDLFYRKQLKELAKNLN